MKRLVIGIIFAFCVINAFAEYNKSGLPDSSEIREQLIETWFYAPISIVRSYDPQIRVNEVGEKFQIYPEVEGEVLYVRVCPRKTLNMEVYSDKGHTTEGMDIFPKEGRGSWVLARDVATGNPLYIRYYIMADSEVYLQFTCGRAKEPADTVKIGQRWEETPLAYCDLVCYNTYIRTNVPTGLPFERFFDASLMDIKKWTGKTLPWEYLTLYPDSYEDTRQMIGVIRSKLKNVIYTDDAMYDENNKAVFVTTGEERTKEKRIVGNVYLGGAGFLKWIADGISEPLMGAKLNRDPLLVETVHYKETGYQGLVSQKYSLSFSLDWIRNLSSAIISIRTKKNYMYNESGCDVDVSPFACVVKKDGTKNALPYIKDTGYSLEVLKPLLYTQAITDPDTFFFGALATIDKHKGEKTSEIKVFNDCCAVFAFFDKDERFKCAVFQNGKEVPLDKFCQKYADGFISLTRVHSSKKFFPDPN